MRWWWRVTVLSEVFDGNQHSSSKAIHSVDLRLEIKDIGSEANFSSILNCGRRNAQEIGAAKGKTTEKNKYESVA